MNDAAWLTAAEVRRIRMLLDRIDHVVNDSPDRRDIQNDTRIIRCAVKKAERRTRR